MAIVSDIEIRLRADIARLQQDMDRARREVSSTMSNITSVVKGAMGALAAIGGIAAFAGFIKSAIDATDAVSDISQRTGVAIKDIAGLQLWFQIGGAEAGEFESSMIKLSKAIATNGDAFKRIGVSTREANGALRSNVDVIRDSADALAKMQDGTAKTALAIELFGKSGATLIPILNSGSQGLQEMTEMAEKLGLTYDGKVVEQAGKFNDTLDFLGLAAQGVGRQVAAQLLPSLNSLAGSFLKFVTQSNGIKKACEAIVFGFKSVYTFGVTVGTMFQTLGTLIGGSLAFITTNLSTIALGLKQAIEGDYSKAWATLTSGGKAAGAIVSSTFKDLKTDISAAATTIGEVWTDTGGEAIEALAAINKQSKYVSEEERKELEKRAAAWAQLKRTLEDARDASEREADGLPALTAAEKANLDLTRDLADKKIVLTNVQEKYARGLIAEASANAVLVKSNKEYEDFLESMAKNAREAAAARAGLINAAEEEAEQNEWLVKTFGMAEDAVIRLEAARVREQMVQKLGRELNQDEIDDLERLAALKERSAKAVADRGALEETKQFWTDIEKTAHDTFVSIADGGKNAFQRLKDTAKNVFFDWLYQMTLKKWIVNIGTATSGTAGVSGIAGATTGAAAASAGGGTGNALGIAGGLGSLASGVGLLGAGGLGLQAGFGALMSSGLAGVSAAVSGGIAAIGAGTGASIAAGMGTIAGALGPIALGIVGAVALLNKAFGRGSKELTGNSKLTGSLTASEFAGAFQDEWKKKGGWFSSSKTGFDTRAVDTAVSQSLVQAYETITTTSADYARMLGINADSIATRTQSISIAIGKDEAANQKTIAEFFTGVANTVAGELLPEISKFQTAGEEASATLQRLATNYAGFDQVLAMMGSTSQKAFGSVGTASIEARERLIAMSGGIEALAQQTDFFTANFLTQAEQIKLVQGPLNARLAELGYAGITSADQFKQAVQSLVASGRLATEEGAATYAGLLAIAPQFKTVADYLKELSDASSEITKQAEADAVTLAAERRQLEIEIMELSGNTIGALAARRDDELAAADAALRPLLLHIYALQDQKQAAEDATAALEENEGVLRGYVDAALSAVQRAVNAQKEVVTEAYQAAMEKLGASISRINDKIAQTSELSKLLQGSLIASPGDAAGVASRAAAQAQVTMALAVAKSSGILPSAESLKDALSVLNQDATDQFATLAEYQRSVARTNAEIGELGGLTDKQLSTAELQLQALEAQKTQAEQAYQAEIERLDSIVVWAQAQVDAINGVNNTTMSVVTAVATLQVALEGLRIGATPSNPNGGNLSVEDLYRTVLGREGEAAGIEYWKNVFGSVVDADEYKAFIQGAVPELEMRQPPVVPDLSSRTMSSSATQPDMAQMSARLDRIAAATEQFASQFNNVSAGGNALLMETN